MVAGSLGLGCGCVLAPCTPTEGSCICQCERWTFSKDPCLLRLCAPVTSVGHSFLEIFIPLASITVKFPHSFLKSPSIFSWLLFCPLSPKRFDVLQRSYLQAVFIFKSLGPPLCRLLHRGFQSHISSLKVPPSSCPRLELRGDAFLWSFFCHLKLSMLKAKAVFLSPRGIIPSRLTS